MAYPIYMDHGGTHDGSPSASHDLAAAYLKHYPRATKGKKAKSQRSRSRRRKAAKK